MRRMSRPGVTLGSPTSRGGGRRQLRLLTVLVVQGAMTLAAAPAYAAPAAINVGPGTQPPGTTGLNTMLSWGSWLVSFVCVVGLLTVAGMMALRHRRGESGESLGSLGWVLGACVLGSAAGPIANALLP